MLVGRYDAEAVAMRVHCEDNKTNNVKQSSKHQEYKSRVDEAHIPQMLNQLPISLRWRKYWPARSSPPRILCSIQCCATHMVIGSLRTGSCEAFLSRLRSSVLKT